MEIINLALRTGFSFKKVFGSLEKTLEFQKENYIGIADQNNSYGHVALEKKCIEKKINPIFGVRLTVVLDAPKNVKPRGQFGHEYIFIAQTDSALKEIYNLIKISHDNFYYRGNISEHDVLNLSENVFVIAESFDCPDRIDFIALSPNTNRFYLNEYPNIPRVAIVDNYYPTPLDKDVYEIFTFPRETNFKTSSQHILTTLEWELEIKRKFPSENIKTPVKNTHFIAKQCKAKLTKAPMIKWSGSESINYLCKLGASKRGIDIKNDGVYKERFDREVKVINEKDFGDYFLVVADLIKWAKTKMLVGASRGSSAGSLVCYLMGITEVDPIEYGLYFERFIDLNRDDLPDIDIDFPDTKRKAVLKYLIKKYGGEKVRHISTISKMKPNVSVNEWAKNLKIPPFETESLKNSVIERPKGDKRANLCLADTFETIETGKDFLETFPCMESVKEIEGHPRHSGIHAAGIIVCNDPIHYFCGVNTRKDINTSMLDKDEAEYLNLLKIDVLGLKTLSVLEDCGNQIGFDNNDFYKINLKDEKTFLLLNEFRFSGVFQFEGDALSALTRKIGIRNFNDMVILTALARPASLQSGNAARYVKYYLGKEEPKYVSELHKKITFDTFGILVYQEQLLETCRLIGKMDWKDINILRKALSKSLGDEFFEGYKEKFLKGAKETGLNEDDSDYLWGQIKHAGNYAFNKAHSVSYCMISYWTAYLKANFPLEFTVSNLNNSKDDEAALKILRDAFIFDGIEYIPFDIEKSKAKWSVEDGKIIGGAINLKGIGIQKANKFISDRSEGKAPTKSILEKIKNPETPFDILFPAKHFWGDIYKRPSLYGLDQSPVEIINIDGKGEFCFIGMLKEKSIKDLNEYSAIAKRKGKVLDGDSLMVTIKIQDDTDSVMCSVNRFRYHNDIGQDIFENSVEDKDWFIIKGEIVFDYRYIFITDIVKLDDSVLEK